ncbi:MAG: TolC family protein [Proteiniphilum sp.]|nr:TolC family protein [Proteiniphilum sp.]
MRRRIIYSLILAIMIVPVYAQDNVASVLNQIESNSTTLSAIRQQIEAQKIENRTDIFLNDPEVEFSYLWGKPSEIGTQRELSVTQSFDFPTAYAHRSKISKMRNNNLELQYKSERLNILLNAKQICINIAYNNALNKEYEARLENAQQIAKSYQSRFDAGDASILEKNKALINLTTVENEKKLIDIERKTLLSELKALNGGIEITFDDTEILNAPISSDFNSWYADAEIKSPTLQYLSQQIDIDKQQVKLNTALSLPKFTAGYASEKTFGEDFKGITVGISIPLWENKNKVKLAKAQVKSTELLLEDSKLQFYTHLQQLHKTTFGLQESAQTYRSSILNNNNEELLKKALDAGQISLIEYLLESEYYYDVKNKMLEAERDFNLSLTELRAVEL